ncbi:MAG: bifunctional 2-polyprenyl-6-hydroxyphenol methylase/3-demethylubiquinol 3-O-methyltransferase UbiG [Chromatiales bacterium]|nr:bifunctional 2-polyprenyl-6-hydroxyphenol methylase/3-demethylubiquinol 3-O-methyltransferase UbiG [Chromatiales bacterium]
MEMNVQQQELDKFEAAASSWWDAEGVFKTLHIINPLRLAYINARTTLTAKRVLDVGCGGGLLCEAMASEGAEVSGIDLGNASLETARLHLRESRLSVAYQCESAEQHAEQHEKYYDIVTCMELLEHVPEPQSVVSACIRAVKPGGDLFFSTINRTPKAYLVAIVGAEYIAKLIPKGTHDYQKLIKPSELATMVKKNGADICDISGMHYLPIVDTAVLTSKPEVNYLMHCKRF